jgi:hypothetical protein
MVKKAVAITFLLLIVYSVFVYFFQSKITRTGQNQYSANIVKSEEYLYEDGQKADILILGSSMASRLVADSLPKGCFNLAMAGMGIYDGISMLEKSSRKPRLVLIEMNVVLRDLNKDLDADLFNPFLYPLRKYIPVLRKKYQPIAVLKALARDASGVKSDPGLFKLPKDLFEKELATVEKNFSAQPDSAELKRKFNELSAKIQEIRKENIEVVFFEMPFYEKARNLAGPKTVRDAFHRYFPESQFKYVDIPADVYETSDGIHLAVPEAVRYTRYLKLQLNQIVPSISK